MMVIGKDGVSVQPKESTGTGTESIEPYIVNQYEYITGIGMDDEGITVKYRTDESEDYVEGRINLDDYDQSIIDICDHCAGFEAVKYAEQFLYDTELHNCTWDFRDQIEFFDDMSDNETSCASKKTCYNCGYDSNQTNIVTSCFMKIGLVTEKYIAVNSFINYLDEEKNGFKTIDFEDARTGDIWIKKSTGTVIVVGVKGEVVYTIGTFRFSKDYVTKNAPVCQTVCKTGDDSQYQRIIYSSKKKSEEGTIYTYQGSNDGN